MIEMKSNEIKERLKAAAKNSKADVVITEIGGTVGDIESLPFLEAIRQARRDFGYENTLYIHNTLLPYLKAANEIKTKPTQLRKRVTLTRDHTRFNRFTQWSTG